MAGTVVGPDYGNPSYWDERYAADEGTYDWYQDYSTLASYLQPFLRPGSDFEILIPGCGNSRYTNITCIDISTVAINLMGDLYSEKEEMEFTVMDARKMEYVPDQCFDLIIDKALMDALTGGVFLMISHAPPARRLPLMEPYLNNMEVEIQQVEKLQLRDLVEEGEALFHYLYICKKVQS
eukprot:scaffold1287_cov253-Ochromonas_danica.AAC.26